MGILTRATEYDQKNMYRAVAEQYTTLVSFLLATRKKGHKKEFDLKSKDTI